MVVAVFVIILLYRQRQRAQQQTWDQMRASADANRTRPGTCDFSSFDGMTISPAYLSHNESSEERAQSAEIYDIIQDVEDSDHQGPNVGNGAVVGSEWHQVLGSTPSHDPDSVYLHTVYSTSTNQSEILPEEDEENEGQRDADGEQGQEKELPVFSELDNNLVSQLSLDQEPAYLHPLGAPK